jgi:alkylhydroperoxidase/carboxymuconolactone decarboxylase family protein YurZ
MERKMKDADDPDELHARSERYLDGLFGAGAGRKHSAFVDRLAHPALRETLHAYHVMEADTRWLSVEENYLIGLAVLCAQRAYAPAGMFAKTLLHHGVAKEKILETVARLTMWVGGLAAAEAAAHVQKALREYEKDGLASMAAWFPEEGAR